MRIIAIDWSGAKHGAGKKIWAAEFRDDKPVEELITGKNGEAIKQYLIGAAKDGETIVGLDFAFSFPAWFVWEHAPSARDLWSVVADRGETWLGECTEPFWGRRGIQCRVSPEKRNRWTEKNLKIGNIQPKSVFQINGGGSVGTGSIRGMKMLHELGSDFRIWPFDGANLPLIIEIWPRALTGEVKKCDEAERKKYLSQKYKWMPESWRAAAEKCEDAFDAVVSACVMQKHKAQILSLAPATDQTIKLEGQIWRPQ